MSYPWGLHHEWVGPGTIRMLTADLFSPLTSSLIVRAIEQADQ
jgi:hypothetical protein